MSSKKVNDLINQDFSSLSTNLDIYQMFISKTNIEHCGEEEFVLKEIVKGTPKTEIIDVLKQKHPELGFSTQQVDRFLSRNNEAVRFLVSEGKGDLKKHLLAREELDRDMVGLILMTKSLIKEAYENRNTNKAGFDKVLSAIRSLESTLTNYMKFAGYLNERATTEVNINVLGEVSERKNRLANKILEADFKELKDAKVSENKETNS